MSFELRDRDLLGRIGRLRTKGGEVETPAFMPVINPLLQTLTPRRMKKEFGCDIVITNSYIIRKQFGDVPDLNVHELLDYGDVVVHIFSDSERSYYQMDELWGQAKPVIRIQ